MQIDFLVVSLYKRLRTPLHLIFESICAVSAMWFLVYTLESSYEKTFNNIYVYIGIFACHLIVGFVTKLHKISIRYYASRRTVGKLSIAALLTSSVFFLVISPAEHIHINFIFLYTFFIVSVSLLLRQIFKDLLYYYESKSFKKCIIIGESEKFMFNASLRIACENYSVTAFFDTSKRSVGSIKNGIKISDLIEFPQYLKKSVVDLIIILDGNAGSQYLLSVTKSAHEFDIPIKVLEEDLETKKVSEATFKDFKVEDVLGRAEVSLNRAALVPTFKGRSVLVTGAGGSIGSELCRQLLQLEPSRLILLEHSENALYQVQQTLESITVKNGTMIVPCLGSVTDAILLDQIMNDHKVDIVLHAAAYKHVNMVEKNIGAAIYNNAIGSKILVDACIKNNIEHALLVSTDKAVRPTSIMGATKRLAELIFLKAKKAETGCNFSAVRFGNVLGSSGSVIPRFQEQIQHGGPVTLTHLEVTRYFMTIGEAVNLILHSLTIAEHGDLFLLDMGEPIKIKDLADSMIFLARKTPFYENENAARIIDKNTEIFVKIVGLTKGEKLYEELLINNEAIETVYPKIFKANEVSLPNDLIEKVFSEIHKMCVKKDFTELSNAFIQLDLQYAPVKNHSSGEQLPGIITHSDALHNNHQETIVVKKREAEIPEGRENESFYLKSIYFLLHKYFLFSRGITLGARAVILLPNRRVVLVKHTYQSGWSLPGGGVEVGENVFFALKREIMQETGIMLSKDPDLFAIYHNKKISKRDHVALFVAFVDSELDAFKPSAEISDCKAYPLDDLPPDLDVATHRRLAEVLHDQPINEIW